MKKSRITNILFLLPVLIPFTVVIITPFFVGSFYSLTDWDGMGFDNFVGLANYIEMFSTRGFVYSLVITALFTVVNMIFVNVVAFGFALLCTQNIKVANFCRMCFFVPNLIGGIVLGHVWRFIFNDVLRPIFMDSSMLSGPNQAFFAIVIVSTWQMAGWIMMIYITGLQTIPKDILEASSIDGASNFRKMVKIKMPMIMNTFTVCIFLTLVRSFQIFDLNFALTQGGPARILDNRAIAATEFIALNIYNTSVIRREFALGQAMAVVFFIALAIISLTQVYISKKKEVEM